MTFSKKSTFYNNASCLLQVTCVIVLTNFIDLLITFSAKKVAKSEKML